MQLLGNTQEERAQYRRELLEAKKAPDFDIDTFNRAWFDRFPVIESQPIKKEAIIEKVQGGEITPEDIDGAGDDEKLREVLRGIQGSIEAYKLENDIEGKFSKEKNGTTQFLACLATAADRVVKPSRILKRETYREIRQNSMINDNAYDSTRLLQFIDICVKLCAREGLCFNRALYIALTGMSYDFFNGIHDYLTSNGINLREKVLQAEHGASLNFAYNSDIGNMRNLNEGEAITRKDTSAQNQLVDASALRALPMK